MTINEAIEKLLEIRQESPLAGQTCLVLCLVDSGLEYMPVTGLNLELSDGGGAIARVDAEEPNFQDCEECGQSFPHSQIKHYAGSWRCPACFKKARDADEERRSDHL